MPPTTPWPELQPLAARIAVGELDGDPAIDAIVEAIVVREHAAGRGVDTNTLRREAIAAVRADRVLMAMLRPVAAPALEQPASMRAPAIERMAASASSRAAHAAIAGPSRASGSAKVRVAASSSDDAIPALDDGETFARAQRARRGTAAAGIAGGVVIGAAAWWLFLRETPCERFARQACIELAEPCSIAEVESHLEAKGIDDARCDAVREAVESSIQAVGPEKRRRTYERTAAEQLGFDPRTGEPPPPVSESVVAPTAPLVLARGLPQLRGLVTDEAFIYLGTDDAVLRLLAIGGQFETIAPARMPNDIVPTADFVYWRAQEADGSTSLWVDRKRGEYPPQALAVAPAKPTITRCVQGLCAFVDGTDGAVWTVAQDGTPAKKLGAAQSPAPVELWLDEGEIAWLVGGPQGAVMSIPTAGGVARVLAGAEADPRELVGDGDALWWIANGAVRRIARSGGDVATLVPSGATAMAVDSTRLFVAQGPTGTIVALPKAGGAIAELVSGQPGIGRVAVDGGAIYWERGGELLRLPKR